MLAEVFRYSRPNAKNISLGVLEFITLAFGRRYEMGY